MSAAARRRRRRRWGRRLLLGVLVSGVLLLLAIQPFKLGDVRIVAAYPAGTAALGPRIRVASWNIEKESQPGFRGQLDRLLASEDPDLVLLQEAVTRTGTEFASRGAHFARSFGVPGHWATGTLTAARLQPVRAFALESSLDEALVATPKTTLVTEYPLERGGTLLVANVHGLNTPDEWLLERQLRELADRIADHQGPMIVGGDFNTWSRARNQALTVFAARLGLSEVSQFPSGRRTGALGRWTRLLERLGVDPTLPLDRMLYRGLEVTGAHLREDLDASDHVALIVDFR